MEATIFSLITLTLFLSVGCSSQDEVRIDVSGTISTGSNPVPDGTLVLTPLDQGEMPVAALIEAGKFAFDATTGPKPGEYLARVNAAEATIEEISEAAQQDPRQAARQFNVNRTSASAGQSRSPEASIVIGDQPGQVIAIELK
ncbi:hypothetical protein NHH03_15225 [Stieleria sp. TO1_6]|uniref:hypothetical protein n=1 Tax=Stieleria tagensis TaxID=2956795 RepID=UPI00209B5E15|nr:hypothetical protein [Stieleria tagensis]MCO8123098.1 hypothetical protein [Stieleria tagensis]